MSNIGNAFCLSPPIKFDCRDIHNWPKWIRQFERYRVASGLDKRDEAFQVNTLIYSRGDEAEDILNASELQEGENLICNKVKDCFDKHYIGEQNIIFERARFIKRKQQSGETAESFVTAVHNLAGYCRFGTLRDELIHGRIVVGIRDITLSEMLQLDAKLTLNKAVSLVTQSKTMKEQQVLLHSVSGHVHQEHSEEMHVISAVHKKEGNTQQRQKPNTSGTLAVCHRCGRSHNWKDCPATDGVTLLLFLQV